jgi:hypothetical protein
MEIKTTVKIIGGLALAVSAMDVVVAPHNLPAVINGPFVLLLALGCLAVRKS